MLSPRRSLLRQIALLQPRAIHDSEATQTLAQQLRGVNIDCWQEWDPEDQELFKAILTESKVTADIMMHFEGWLEGVIGRSGDLVSQILVGEYGQKDMSLPL